MKVTFKVIPESEDSRGTVFLSPLDWASALTSLRNVHVTTVKPGKVRGNHLHRKTTEVLVVKSTSNFEFHWQDNGADAGVRELGGASVTLIEVPPGTAHAVLNAGTSDLIVVALSDVAYDPDQPDVERQVLVRGVSDD